METINEVHAWSEILFNLTPLIWVMAWSFYKALDGNRNEKK